MICSRGTASPIKIAMKGVSNHPFAFPPLGSHQSPLARFASCFWKRMEEMHFFLLFIESQWCSRFHISSRMCGSFCRRSSIVISPNVLLRFLTEISGFSPRQTLYYIYLYSSLSNFSMTVLFLIEKRGEMWFESCCAIWMCLWPKEHDCV